MSINSVIVDVCAVVGVRPPTGTVFVTAVQDRTLFEMVKLANEMVQRISYDTRDWQVFRKLNTFTGTGAATAFPMPADYQRMLKSTNVYSSTMPTMPLRFISDGDEWLQRELLGLYNPSGEWTIFGNQMHVRPTLPNGSTLKFYYQHSGCVNLSAGGLGNIFMSDTDTPVLPERLLRLGMIWQWKAQKGGTYSEDLQNYEDALAMLAGADKPGPILIGNMPVSGSTAYVGPVPAPGDWGPSPIGTVP